MLQVLEMKYLEKKAVNFYISFYNFLLEYIHFFKYFLLIDNFNHLSFRKYVYIYTFNIKLLSQNYLKRSLKKSVFFPYCSYLKNAKRLKNVEFKNVNSGQIRIL